MPSISAGQTSTFTIPQGQVAQVIGDGIAILIAPVSSPISISGQATLGPYPFARIVSLQALQPISYTVAVPPASGSGGTTVGLLGIVARPVISTPTTAGASIGATSALFAGTPSPTTAIQWLRDGVAISGATSIPYVSISSDAGKSLTLRITATNSAGTLTATSDAITVGAASGGGGTTPTYLTAAAVRSKLPLSGTAVAPANNVRTSRLAEYAVTPVTNPEFDFANVYVNASFTTGPQEILATAPIPLSAAVLTNLNGVGLDQSAATLTPLTFFNASTGVPGYMIKLDGSNVSAAEFSANGGVISGDGMQITPPTICAAYKSDPVTGVTLNGAYFVQTEISPAVGANYLSTTVAGTRTDLGDQIKDSTVRTGVFVKNWTTIGTTSAGMTFGPCGVHGTSATGVKTVGVAGDSIANDNFDRDTVNSRYGDAQGATNFIGRALNNKGYPFARAAISGSNATNPYTYGGYSIRQWQLRNCSAIFTDMGHNDRGATFSNIMLYLRAHWAKLRAAGVGGNPKIIQTSWAPMAASTDSWATKTNQTPSTLAGSMQFDSFNPFIKAGVFNTASGDCDVGYDLIADIYTAATTLGATDVTPGYVPTNGTAQYFWQDTTHPTSILHAAIGAPLLGPKLTSLLGF